MRHSTPACPRFRDNLPAGMTGIVLLLKITWLRPNHIIGTQAYSGAINPRELLPDLCPGFNIVEWNQQRCRITCSKDHTIAFNAKYRCRSKICEDDHELAG